MQGLLAEHRQASVVAVEALEDLVEVMSSLPLCWRTSLFPIQSWITSESAPGLLQIGIEPMGGVEIISLDIDGNDYWVAESLDLSDIQLIAVEYNPLFGDSLPVTVPRNDEFDRTKAHSSWLYCGASLRAWLGLFERRGFTFVGTNRAGCNAFFCSSDRVDRIPLHVPTSVDISRYVDWRVRDSRDAEGRMTYLARADAVAAIGHLPVMDVVTGEMLTVADAHVKRIDGSTSSGNPDA